MSSSTSPIDFATLMAPVCLALLGEPQEKHRGGMQWRYGTHGSLRVEIDKGVFEDHETGQKGGTLKIIECRGGMDKPRAKPPRNRNRPENGLRQQKTAPGCPRAVTRLLAEVPSLLLK
jgi:hypothetical protein